MTRRPRRSTLTYTLLPYTTVVRARRRPAAGRRRTQSRPPGAGRREPGPGRRSPADWPRRPGRDHRPGCAGRPTGSHFFQLLHRQVADGAFRRGGELTNPLYYRVLRKCTNRTSRGSTDVFVTNHVTAGARRSAGTPAPGAGGAAGRRAQRLRQEGRSRAARPGRRAEIGRAHV